MHHRFGVRRSNRSNEPPALRSFNASAIGARFGKEDRLAERRGGIADRPGLFQKLIPRSPRPSRRSRRSPLFDARWDRRERASPDPRDWMGSILKVSLRASLCAAGCGHRPAANARGYRTLTQPPQGNADSVGASAPCGWRDYPRRRCRLCAVRDQRLFDVALEGVAIDRSVGN
jgi:hypothetical protein